jgi:acyl carrier protein
MTGFALIVFLEDAFAISVDPDVFTEMNTLQELYMLVENSMKVRQTSC